MKLLLTMNLPYTRVSGGTNRSNRCLAEHLSERHSVRVVVPALAVPSPVNHEQFVAELVAEGISVHSDGAVDIFTLNGVEVHCVVKAESLRAYLVEQIREFEPDWVLVSSEDPSQNLLDAALRSHPRRVVYLAHTPQMFPFGPASLYPGKARTELVGQAAGIVTISNFVAGYIKEWTGFDSFINHPPHFGSPPFSNFGNSDSGYVLLMNGSTVKGVSIFLELARMMPEVEFASLPGYGTTPADRAALAAMSNVTLLENRRNLEDILCQTRVLLMPTLWIEGFGMAVVDAMLRGIPVLASNYGGLVEAKLGTDYLIPVRPIEHFEDQLDANLLPVPIVPTQDVGPWQLALSGLLSNREIYEKQSALARNAALSFVSDLSVRPFEDWLVQLAASGVSRSKQSFSAPDVSSSESEAFNSVAGLSPEHLALLVRRLRKKKALSSNGQNHHETNIPRAPRDGALPLSYAQQCLWLSDQMQHGSAAYNIVNALRLRGRLNVPAIEFALTEIIRRHEILRTTFAMVDSAPVQVIHRAQPFTLAVLDVSTEGEAEVRRVAMEESQRPFDLSAGPLLRASVLRLSEQEHVLLCTMHHIISDGWSMGVLIRELTTLYEAFGHRQQSPLPELGIQYADYAHWQREWLQGEVLEQQLNYWKQQLAGVPAVLELPTDYPRPAVQTFRGAHQSLTLPVESTTGLKALTQREGVTLFMTLLAAFQTLLWRYSGQEDIVVSTGIANRNRAETEPLIGFFVNTLVLRTNLSGDPTFAELLRRVREVTLGAYAHQDVPFELLVEALAPERDARYTPLFQVMLVLQNARVGEAVKLAGLEVSGVGGESGTAKFDLTLFVEERGEELGLVLEYNTDLFAARTIEEMLESFRRLVEGIVTEPERSIGSFEMIDAEERRRLTGRGRENLLSVGDVSVARLFEAAAARDSQAVAIECGERRLSYGELDERANTLANYLLRHGARPGTIVGLLTSNMSETIVGMLGSLKAGAAFMPLDVRQPAARLRKLLGLAPPEFLLTETKMLAALGQLLNQHGPLKVMCVDGPVSVPSLCPLCLGGELSEQHSHHRDTEDTEIAQRKARVEVLEDFLEYHNPVAPPVSSDPDQLSYIYFTSGSSGTPKAIAGRLKGIAHFINWEIEELGVGAGVRVSQLLSPSFDGSLRDVFLPLCVGGVVCVPERREQVLEGRGLVQWLEQAQIEVMHCVPSVFRALVNEELRAEELSALRYVVMAGEALVGRDVAKWKAVYGERVGLVNLYGTSETTMAKFSYRVGVGDEEREVMPIGKPIAGAEAYLLDERGEPCGRGMVGEIYIRTPYRSLGYYRQPELTAAVFVPNPFSTDANDLVHKTGDMGRVLEDGNFEYLGRRDEQVKVRGARVELKEVENAVRGQAGVLDVAVIEREDGSGYTYLCAYLVLAEGVQTVEVAEGLAHELPDYMVPSAYVELAELPRTISGKVDRRALPAVSGEGSGVEYVVPRTAVEELLAESWQQLLGRERVGVEDNFFRLGGHSLLATQVMSRVRETFGVEVGLRVLFERPTVRGLGEVIEEQLRGAAGEAAGQEAGRQAAPAIAKVSRAGELMLSFAQQRLWFLDQLEPGSNAYNMGAAVRLQGTLDLTALEQSFREVIRRHESLRTRFGVVNGVPVQVIDEAPQFTLPVLDLSEDDRETEARRVTTEESQRPFDLCAGPLLRASVLRLSEQEYVLLCTMHHIISDGWSMGVLIRELTTLYQAYATGHESPLPELPIQYADYAHWQREWLQGEVLEQQLNYWQQQLAGVPAVLELPTDHPRPEVQTLSGETYSFTFPPDLTKSLEDLSRREGVTLFMTLLAAWQTLFSRYSGQEDIVIGTDIAGRTRAETEGLIGFFVNQLVLRTDLSGNPTFLKLLGRVREVMLGAYVHQDVPFDKLVEVLNPDRSRSRTPLFQAKLTLHNAPKATVELPGLTLEAIDDTDETRTVKFDLVLNFVEGEWGLSGSLNFSTELFKRSTIIRMIEHLQQLLSSIAAQPDAQLNALQYSSEAENQQRILAKRRREQSKLKKLKTITLKPVSQSARELIKAGHLSTENKLPLVVQPAHDNVDFYDWVRHNQVFIRTSLLKYGALLFRGFGLATQAAFERFLPSISARLMTYMEGATPRTEVGQNLYTSTEYPADQSIAFHNELTYVTTWPKLIWFHCIQPAESGGETPIADVRRVFERIDPSIRKRFDEKGWMLVRNFGDGVSLPWQRSFHTTDKSEIEAYCRQACIEVEWKADGGLRTRQVRPAIAVHPQTLEPVWFNHVAFWHVSSLDKQVREAMLSMFSENDLPYHTYYGDGVPIEDSVVEEIRGAYEMERVEFGWQRGDILMLDNVLVAHGRNPFEGKRRVIVAMGEGFDVNADEQKLELEECLTQ
jgi:amino acid adenylation domain-containing protein